MFWLFLFLIGDASFGRSFCSWFRKNKFWSTSFGRPQEDTGFGGKNGESCIGTKKYFLVQKYWWWSDIYIFSRVELTSTYRDQLLVSHRKETTLQHFTTFYNILQNFTTFTTFYNIHTTFTTFYNILQHYTWRCVVSPEGR